MTAEPRRCAGHAVIVRELIDGGVRRLVHRDLPSPEACAAHEEDWTHYVGRLAVVAAGGDPGPDAWM